MFEKLFKRPAVLARHRDAPYAEERERYLSYCSKEGFTHETLLLMARELLWVARKLRISAESKLTLEQVQAAARGWAQRERGCGQRLNTKWTRIRFVQVARSWLRFLGCWHEFEEPIPFHDLIEAFDTWMKNERGLCLTTIQNRCGYLRQFLRWYATQGRPFSAIDITDVDAFLAACGNQGWSRVSVKNMATALRAFFKYAGTEGWCRPLLAFAIQGPRVFAEESFPLGPSWHDVGRLIQSMETGQKRDIRDKAIVMLFAIYGFRASEVCHLRLDDIDWEHDLLSVSRAKRRGTQSYPLIPTVGNAIIRYIQQVRPPSPWREVFLTLNPPFRPLSRGSLQYVTSGRMKKIGIHIAHYGPHSLRHACAAHLIAEGFSLKEIGDHLGHRSTSATRIYAKVDLPGLREVAAFDIGGLI
jgi:site-specific recombinase XerD